MGKKRTTTGSTRRDAPLELPELPEALLVNILARIPVQARLLHCAPVSSAWAAAAILAPSKVHVQLGGPSQQRLQRLRGWLAQRADHVTQLTLSTAPAESRLQLQLPCARLTSLQELFIRNMDVSMIQQQTGTGSSSSSNASFNSRLLPALRRLDLYSCSLSCDGIRQLSSLTRLTDLCLERLSCSDMASTQQLLPQALCDVLQQTPRLDSLVLTGLEEATVTFGAAALSPLSAMEWLVNAVISTNIFGNDCLKHLPIHLFGLFLEPVGHSGSHSRLSLTRAAWPQLQHHDRLVDLRLVGVDVEPSILPLLGSLQELQLESVWAPAGAGADGEGKHALLPALGQLTQLDLLRADNQDYGSSDPQHMSALTASLHLKELLIYEEYDVNAGVGPIPLPAGAIQHMFSSGRQLPHLHELIIDGTLTMKQSQDVDVLPNISAQDVAAIARALPALDGLSLVNVLEDEQAVLQLTALTRLTSLCVGGTYMGDKDVSLLARLTALQNLEACHIGVTAMGLLHLTALQRCTQLAVWDAPELEQCLCNAVSTDSGAVAASALDAKFTGHIDSLLLCASAEDQAAGVPPVWRQLQDRCMMAPNCQQALEAAV